MTQLMGNPGRRPSKRLLGGILLAMLCGCTDRDPPQQVTAPSPTGSATSKSAAPVPPLADADRFALLGVFNRGCA